MRLHQAEAHIQVLLRGMHLPELFMRVPKLLNHLRDLPA